MSNTLQAILAGVSVAAIFGLFLWMLCRVLDRNCDSQDFGYSPKDFDAQAKKLQEKAEKEVKRRPRLSVVRFWNV